MAYEESSRSLGTPSVSSSCLSSLLHPFPPSQPGIDGILLVVMVR